MSVSVVIVPFILTALRDVHALGATDQTRTPRVDSSATPAASPYAAVHSDDSNASDPRIFARINHTPVVDSLVPVAHSSESVTPSDNKQLTAVVVVVVLAFVGLCTIVAMIFFLVRYFMRRAAIKRRRQASWILRSGQWNMEPKRTNAHETGTGCSDTSSSFSAYPYPLSEHF